MVFLLLFLFFCAFCWRKLRNKPWAWFAHLYSTTVSNFSNYFRGVFFCYCFGFVASSIQELNEKIKNCLFFFNSVFDGALFFQIKMRFIFYSFLVFNLRWFFWVWFSLDISLMLMILVIFNFFCWVILDKVSFFFCHVFLCSQAFLSTVSHTDCIVLSENGTENAVCFLAAINISKWNATFYSNVQAFQFNIWICILE